MKLLGIFTRRRPATIKTALEGVPVFHVDDAEKMTGEIDVMILCGGSASDLPIQGPLFAGLFNTVDGYDAHARVPDYFQAVNSRALAAGKVSIIAGGWDPGIFSVSRLCRGHSAPGNLHFLGQGVSQEPFGSVPE